MIRNHLLIMPLLSIISTATIAAPWQDPDKVPGNTVVDVTEESGEQTQAEPNIELSIEDQERQKIIAELTYRLDTKSTCTQKLAWSDKGSGAELDGYFFSPLAESSYYIIGGYASRKGDAKSKKCVVSVRQSKNNPEGTPELLVPPGDWSLIWTDKGSGSNKDGSMWNGVPPGKEYKCLGSVMQKGYKKPVMSNYRCVHSSLTKEITIKSVLWSDKGSGADRDVTVFKLSNSKSFFAVGRKINKVKTYDLNDSASVEPDAAVVEKLLAQRMEEINKIEEAEKKRLADEDAKKRLAEEATASNRIAEEKRIAEESEQQERLAVETEQEKLEQGTEDIHKAEEPEQQSSAKVVAVQQPNVDKEINQQKVTEKSGEKDSKSGLKILFVFMLLLLIYTAYKVFRIFINIIKGDN